MFSITKDVYESPCFEFKSDVIDKPISFDEMPDLVVYLEVVIYKDLVLQKGDSLLTNLYCINSLYNVAANSYKLHHTTSGIPSWVLVAQN
ncbi:MAG: hypothetical protein ACI849_001628 [Patiriisocius sp.]